jgi:hypothetical protein
LREKELFTATKPQKPVKLTIDNSQICMNMRHANTIFQYLHPLVENMYQRYHRIYLEDFVSQIDPRSYKRSI